MVSSCFVQAAADGLNWADKLMEATFFEMQIYLTEVWKLSFTGAATLLNIWGGLSKILSVFFLFLADALLGNTLTLALSGLLSTTGLVLITVTTMPGYRCLTHHEEESCVSHKEKVLFIIGMGFVALGRAARSASSVPFRQDQSDNEMSASRCLCTVMLFITPVVGFFMFPYIKRWYILFGVSAICTALATLFFLAFIPTFNGKWGPREDGSPLTDCARVFVAAAFNISQSLPEDRDSYHRVPNEEFQELSCTRIFGFLHKAAILPAGGAPKKKRSWRLCSVSEVESTKILIRTVTVSCSYLMSGVVSSTANTYFIEQANNLSTRIGSWKAPLQLFLVIHEFYKLLMTRAMLKILANDRRMPTNYGLQGAAFAVVSCAVAAAVERRRLHMVRRRGLLHLENVTTPMSVAWLIFQAYFLWGVEATGTTGLTQFHMVEGPASMERYAKCMSEAASGVGFMCGALLVYVVGKISETGGGKGWFQQTLNLSRLDRYYWVLTVLCSISSVVSSFGLPFYTPKKELKQLQLKKELTPLRTEEEPVTDAPNFSSKP